MFYAHILRILICNFAITTDENEIFVLLEFEGEENATSLANAKSNVGRE